MDPAYVLAHLEEDRSHWWFRGRRAMLLATLRRVLPPGPHRLLELGCGSGNVLEVLGRFGESVGMESDATLAEAGRAAGLDIRSGELPAGRVVPCGWPDVVLLLDVLEHVDDDAGTLRAAHEVLAVGGILVVAVPAYDWLWSGHDVVLRHRRRYTAERLRAAVTAAGFTIEYLTHFNTLLLPAIALARAWKRWRRDDSHDLTRPRWPLNEVLGTVFALESLLVSRWPMPCGASLLVIGRR